MTSFFSAINHLLPPKYFLYGHSNGAYQVSLFASAFPDRIEKMFLQAAVGFTGVLPDDSYDPYKIRVSDSANTLPSRKDVDLQIYNRENKI